MARSKLSGQLPTTLKTGLIELGSELLGQAQDALGWLCSKTRNTVNYSDPVARERVQRNLDHAVGMLCVAHLMGIFEEHLPESPWASLLEPAEIERLRAYRHIRQCAAAGFTKRRAQADGAAFDSVMSSNEPLRGVITHDSAELTLSPDIVSELATFLRGITDRAIVAAHS